MRLSTGILALGILLTGACGKEKDDDEAQPAETGGGVTAPGGGGGSTTSSTSTATATSASTTAWVAGYYVGYQRDLYPADRIAFDDLTHLIVGRVVPNVDGTLNTAMDVDPVTGPAMAKDLAERTRAAGKTPLLFVGGMGTYDAWVAAASDANRATFVRNLVETMTTLGYEGIDLDWEPIETKDHASVLALARDLRAARPGIVLSVPVGWVNTNWMTVDAFYAQLAAEVDRLNLMSYSMAGPWDSWLSWHSSALRGAAGRTPSSVAASIDAYVAAGVPKAKLGVGAGFYGSCWTVVTGPGQELGGATLAADDNAMSYTNIMTSYHAAAAYRYDETAEAPYLSSATGLGPRGCTYVSYEDERSLYAKARYVVDEGLGGVIIWTVNQGSVATQPENSSPLLRALMRGIKGR